MLLIKINIIKKFYNNNLYLYIPNLNTSLTIRGPSPKYFYTNSDPFTLMKEAVESLATALAIIVLPVPGGPCNKTPLGGSIPIY